MVALLMRRSFVGLLLLSVAALTTARAGAQQQLESLEKLTAAMRKFEAGNQLYKLEAGQVTPTKQDQEALDALAKWLIYRFVSSVALDTTKITLYQRDFKTHIVDRVQSAEFAKNNREFVKQFGPILKQRYKDLFDQDFIEYRYPILNVAPTLVMAAKMRDDTLGDYLAELVADHDGGKGGKNRHDVIKLYAVRGLREYMPVTPIDRDAELSQRDEKRKTREIRTVAALLSFIEKQPTKPLDEEEQNGVRVLRREALETLGLAGAPAVVFGKGVVEAPVAPLLLRVLSAKSDLNPAPGLAERLEAAIGVCQLRAAKVPDYQPEAGVYLVGRTIHEFFTAYNKDLIDVARGAIEPRPAALHWRIYAKRLDMALDKLVENTKSLPVQANAKRLKDEASILFKNMNIQNRTLTSVDQRDVDRFRSALVEKMRPASGQVFRNIKEYSVELDGQ